MAIADLNILLGADISQFDKELRKAQSNTKKIARNLQGIADGIFNNISVPFAAASAAGVKLFTDLDTNFSKIENLVGITGNQLGSFKDGVKSLSGETAKSQRELSDALFTVTSAGLRGSAALEVLEASAKSSAVGLGQTKDVARAVTAIIQAYGEENINAATATEQLFNTVKEGNLDAAQLAPTLGKILPIASALKVSFADLGANVASFTKLGVTAPEALTGVKAALSSILKPTEQAKEALASVGLTVEDLKSQIESQGLAKTFVGLVKAFDGNQEALAKVFGNVEGLANVLGVATNQADDYIAISERMNASSDNLGKGFEKTSKTIGFALTQALETGKNSLIELGDAFAPLVTKASKSISSMLGTFNNLDDATKKSIISFGAFAASTGVALKGLSIFTRGIADSIGVVRSGLGLFRSFSDFVLDMDSNLKKTGGTINGQTIGVFSSLTGTIKNSVKAFQALNIVTKLSLAGLAIGAVLAGVAAYNTLSSAIDKTTASQRANANITTKAKAAIQGELQETKVLVGILENETASREKKEKALQRLQQVNSQYFGQLEIEDGKVKGLTKAYEEYSTSILRTSKLRAASNELVKINEEILKTQQEIDRLNSGDLTGLEKLVDVVSVVNTRQLKTDQAQKQLSALEDQAKEYAKIYEDLYNQEVTGPQVNVDTPSFDTENTITTNTSINTKGSLDGLSDLQKALILADKRLAIHGDAIQAVNEKISAYKSGIDAALEAGANPSSEGIQDMVQEVANLDLQLAQLTRNKTLPPVLEGLPTLISRVKDEAQILQDQFAETTFDNLANGFKNVATNAELFGSEFQATAAKINLVENAIQNLISNGFEAADPAIQNLVNQLSSLKAANEDTLNSMGNHVQNFNEEFSAIINGALIDTFTGLGNAIGDIVTNQLDSASLLANSLGSIADVLSQVGQLAIKTGVAILGIKVSLETINPFAAIAAGTALLALSKVVKQRASNISKGGGSPVKLAKGGLAYGETLAVVGDNPGASFDPEVIAPLSKLKNLIGGAYHITFTEPRWEGENMIMGIDRVRKTLNNQKA